MNKSALRNKSALGALTLALAMVPEMAQAQDQDDGAENENVIVVNRLFHSRNTRRCSGAG